MSLANSYDDFKKEIELIVKQNPLECELYSIVASIIRERDSSKNISLRDVTIIKNQSKFLNSNDRKFEYENGTFGASDFLIVSPDYSYSTRAKELILGCIEIKAIHENLDYKANKAQYDGELKSFKKLICTNGLKWCMYKSDDTMDNKTIQLWHVELGKYERVGKDKKYISDKDIINWNGVDKWDDLLEHIDKIIW